jgi:hypothetical protein
VPESLGVKNVTFCLFSEPIFNGLEMAPEVLSSVVMSFLADLSATYRQSFETESLFGTEQAINIGNRTMSAFSEGLSALQHLKENNPTLHQRVAREMFASLQKANQAADAAFDTRQHLLASRQTSRLRSLVRHTNHLVHNLAHVEPLMLRWRWKSSSAGDKRSHFGHPKPGRVRPAYGTLAGTR